ncbi:MAG: cysteine desulfurase NifS [Deltaproteobacteria bacterium]|nr:cysteine desulfurase NifS [Candidatus Zymogenaceae bacterium]
MKRIYLDYAATTPADPRVIDEMLPFFTEHFGNPSSVHSFGQETKSAVEAARETVSGLLGAAPDEIVFVSGATEANNTALKGTAFAKRDKGNHIITSAIEHHSVSETVAALKKEGFRITNLPVDRYGMVDPDDVKKAIDEKTILISIMHANNEIGTIQPIAEIGKIARERSITFHTDAVQSLGHIPVNVDDLDVDLLSGSSHKFYGPKGVGFLYVRKGTKLTALLFGGDQEKRRRAGTHNTPGIVGTAAAARIAHESMAEESVREAVLRDRLIKGITGAVQDASLNGHPTMRLPNNANISFHFIEGESILLSLDMEGIAASSGSACTSSTLEPSHVLLAIGLSHEVAHGSIRFSLGRWTTDEDVARVIEVLPGIVSRLRVMSPLFAERTSHGIVQR